MNAILIEKILELKPLKFTKVLDFIDAKKELLYNLSGFLYREVI